MKRLILVLTLFICFLPTQAQRYYAAFGARAGKFNSGVTFKYFWNTDNATGLKLDGYYTKMGDGGYTIKGFFIKQVPLKSSIIQLPLDLIIGGGLHGGFFPLGKENRAYAKRIRGFIGELQPDDKIYYDRSVVSVGIDATIELEYQIKKVVPITISVDFCPYYEFINRGEEYIDFGLSIRYLFRY